MTTASEEILARYKRTVSETDSFGRTVVLGPIRPATELAVLRMIGTEERVNQVTYLALACVRKIDETDITPARTLADLDAIMNRLDREGLEAVGTAYAKLKEADGAAKTDEDAKAEVKNG